MTTKQMLFSALMLSSIGNITLTTEPTANDRALHNGWATMINGKYLDIAVLSKNCNSLDHIQIIEEIAKGRLVERGTIGAIKNNQDIGMQTQILHYINLNNAINCNDEAIIINSQDKNNCDRLRKNYEQFALQGFIKYDTTEQPKLEESGHIGLHNHIKA